MKDRSIVFTAGLMMLLITNPSYAEVKIGVGTGIAPGGSGGTGGQFMMPIKIGASFMLEPFLAVAVSNEDADKNSIRYTERSSDDFGFGVGLYGVSNLVENFEIYYGASLGRHKRKDTTKTYDGAGSNIIESTKNRERDQYFVQPTLGISYIVNENILLSIDYGLAYLWGEVSVTSGQNALSTASTDTTSNTQTRTRLMLRYMF